MESVTKEQSNKRALAESDSESMDEQSNKRKRVSNSESDSNNQSAQVQTYKNSIQYIYEILDIQPIKYELISQEGLAHKPVFKFSLKIKLFNNIITFYGCGNSKKQAKTIVSLKAINYLIKIPNLFHKQDIELFEYIISFETKQYNIEQFLIEDNLKQDSNEQNLELLNVTNNLIKNNHKKNIEFDLKTREIIATKNSLIILNHLIPKKVFIDNLIEESGLSHSKIFKVEIRIKKDLLTTECQWFLNCDLKSIINISESFILFKETLEELIFYGIGSSKKIAKSRAAQLLLEILFNIKITNPENDLALSNKHSDEMGTKFKEFADNISELISNKYKEVLEQINLKKNQDGSSLDENELNLSKFLNVYSGIVQSNGIDFSTVKLICLTTGTKCINGESMSQIGTCLNDCHAEILAIRLLRKYLYKKLNEFVKFLQENSDKNDYETNIFESKSDKTKPFCLKKTVNFHLFISSAPCGDSRIFSISDNIATESQDTHPNRKVRGLLRAKVESGMGTIPVSSHEKIQTWDGIMLGERLKVMSCSDKLCKYNVVGVQGALLSQFLDSIYLDSIIVGAYYHKNHLARALYGRVAQNLNELPNGFRVHKPVLSTITNNLQRQISKPSNKSLIWSEELNSQFEIISCKFGKKVDGGHSELCKYEQYKEWIKLLRIIQLDDRFSQFLNKKLNNFKTVSFSYAQAKNFATDYQDAKLQLYKAFDTKQLGKWITKPFEQNEFIINEN